jgi:phosphatidylglycerophosphate synthase
MADPKATQSIDEAQRRPIRSRRLAVMQQFAGLLVRWGIGPNAISLSSMAFAGAGAACMVASASADGAAFRLCCIIAAIAVQLRLIANLMDGVVAELSGKASLTGRLLNEWPDRVSDVLLIVAFGWLVIEPGGWWLGVLAACAAVLTAYCREIGRSVDAPMCFAGPMAKPQRMAALTVALVLFAVWPTAAHAAFWGFGEQRWGVPALTLWLIVVGGAITCVRRLARYHRFAAASHHRDRHDDH